MCGCNSVFDVVAGKDPPTLFMQQVLVRICLLTIKWSIDRSIFTTKPRKCRKKIVKQKTTGWPWYRWAVWEDFERTCRERDRCGNRWWGKGLDNRKERKGTDNKKEERETPYFVKRARQVIQKQPRRQLKIGRGGNEDDDAVERKRKLGHYKASVFSRLVTS